MPQPPLVILASARKESDTLHFLNKVFADRGYELIDLLDYYISPYNYLEKYPDKDEFLKIIDKMLNHNIIVFATPVYWYAMSGLMKTLFDRFTDIVSTNKNLGRKLQGKSTFLLAVGADEDLPPGFEIPFKLTSDYLHLQYQDAIYYSTKFQKPPEQLQETIKDFINKLKVLTDNNLF